MAAPVGQGVAGSRGPVGQHAGAQELPQKIYWSAGRRVFFATGGASPGRSRQAWQAVCSMRSQNSTQWSADPATDRDPDVVVRGKCRCTLVRAWLTEDGWLLVPAVERGFRLAAVTETHQYDAILQARKVDTWDDQAAQRVVSSRGEHSGRGAGHPALASAPLCGLTSRAVTP